MSFVKDMFAVFKKRDIALLESYKESDDVYTFIFEKDKDLTWTAGQYGLFSISHKAVKNGTRPFSIASAPTENVVRLTMRIGDNPSDFKKAMLELKQGMTIKMSGPVGSFYPTDDSPMLLIAGGIGITPFRSIAKQLEAEGNGDKKQIRLLYLDSQKAYPYRDELDRIANKASINVIYLDAKDELHRRIDEFAALNKDNGKYFVAGPKSLVDSVSSYLQNNQIPKRNIKKDTFTGY